MTSGVTLCRCGLDECGARCARFAVALWSPILCAVLALIFALTVIVTVGRVALLRLPSDFRSTKSLWTTVNLASQSCTGAKLNNRNNNDNNSLFSYSAFSDGTRMLLSSTSSSPPPSPRSLGIPALIIGSVSPSWPPLPPSKSCKRCCCASWEKAAVADPALLYSTTPTTTTATDRKYIQLSELWNSTTLHSAPQPSLVSMDRLNTVASHWDMKRCKAQHNAMKPYSLRRIHCDCGRNSQSSTIRT